MDVLLLVTECWPVSDAARLPSTLFCMTCLSFPWLSMTCLYFPWLDALPPSHETVRTRMREQPPIPGVRSRYHAMFPSLRLIAMEEGRRGLYAGMGTHLLRVVPSTAIMFLTFETAVRWLERQQQQRQQQE